MKTPQQSYPELARALGLDNQLFLKREDLHKYGSHKGRSIPLMIKTYAKQGITDFVISSSGNAALAAIHAVSQYNKNNPGSNIKLQIFVGKKIDRTKLNSLHTIHNIQDTSIQIEQVERPKQEAFQLDKEGKAKYLRQSIDDLALEGYIELTQELNKLPNLEAIFIPTSSGTTAQALGQAFQNLNQNPQIHIVQTSFCHPIAEAFNKGLTADRLSIASAIVDNVAHRKQAVIEIIKQTKGFGWIVTDEEIEKAIEITKQITGIDISPNSALSIAGLKKAIENGWKFEGSIVCLITGA